MRIFVCMTSYKYPQLFDRTLHELYVTIIPVKSSNCILKSDNFIVICLSYFIFFSNMGKPNQIKLTVQDTTTFGIFITAANKYSGSRILSHKPTDADKFYLCFV